MSKLVGVLTLLRPVREVPVSDGPKRSLGLRVGNNGLAAS